MFCPSCGLQEIHSNQFCRACGANLKTVRTALEQPDQVTNSAVFARNKIGNMIASKINDIQAGSQGKNNAVELKILAEDVLPNIQKFLESPEEKKLRQLRDGVVTASTGVGLVPLGIILNLFVGMPGLVVVGAGLLILFIGLGIIINGMWLTVPRKRIEDKSPEAERQRELDKSAESSESNELHLSKDTAPPFVSVVEHTTRQLAEKQKSQSEN